MIEFPLTSEEIRLHAIKLAARRMGEMATADQVLADARRYAAWIARGDEPAAPDKEN